VGDTAASSSSDSRGAAARAALMECVYDRIDGVLGAARQPAEVPPKVHFKAAGHGAEVEIDGAMAPTSI